MTQNRNGGWRPWGDHPLVVIIGTIAAVITIIAFVWRDSIPRTISIKSHAYTPDAQVRKSVRLKQLYRLRLFLRWHPLQRHLASSNRYSPKPDRDGHILLRRSSVSVTQCT